MGVSGLHELGEPPQVVLFPGGVPHLACADGALELPGVRKYHAGTLATNTDVTKKQETL